MTSESPLSVRMPRVDSLTGFRWWAAFFVFVYHMQVFAPLPGAVSTVLAQGYLGVTFFFVLSGFVLTWSASDRVSTSTFYWRRFARVYPAHFVALLFAIPVFYSFTPETGPEWIKPVSVGILALSFVLLQGWVLTPTVLFSGNPAAWTLTCEAFFYALHPAMSKVLTPLFKRGALVFAIITVIVAFAYRAAVLVWPASFLAFAPVPVVRLTEFVIGMSLAWAFRRGWLPHISVLVGIGSMAAVVFAIVFAPVLAPGSQIATAIVGFGNELFTVACALAIVAVARRSLDGKHSFFASRIQVRLGEWSFSFYLVHATFMYIAYRIFGPQPVSWANLGWAAILLVIDLAGAFALHHWVERPLEKRMRGWKDRRTVAAIAARTAD